ncbi:MAG: hypothetical protein V4729_04665 [Pseudomonadota bacterium]
MKWTLPLLALLLALAPAAQAEDWILARTDDVRDIRVYLRDTPGSNYKRFYATTRVPASLSSVVAVLSDVPAMPQWITRLKSARLLRRDANREAWVHGVYRLPYPFLEREAVLHSVLRQDKAGVVEIITRAEPGLVPANPKRVRLGDMHSVWRLTPEKKGVVKIELWGEGAPGGYVPPLLFNYNLPDEPQQTLRNLRQMLLRDKYRGKQLGYIREPAER